VNRTHRIPRSRPISRCSRAAATERHLTTPSVHTPRLARCGLLFRLAVFAVVAAVPAGCQDAEPALARGDRFWADSSYTDALAEYRLALRQHPDDETRARTAHAYIETGQFELAREIYTELIRQSPKWTDQAIFDYVAVANRARDRSDRYGLASAVAAAQELRPGLPLDDFAIPLARYYSTTGDPALALDFYERAITAGTSLTVTMSPGRHSLPSS